MSPFELTPLAESDLEELVDYLCEQASPDRAREILTDILRAAAQLAQLPGLGHRREDLSDEDVLFWSVHRWLVVYRPGTKPLQIVRIVSGRRDVRALLGETTER